MNKNGLFESEFENDIDAFIAEKGNPEHMARLLRNLEDLSAGEEYVPDTFYCEALFLQYFVNDDMRNDFALITADFLAHEAQNIRQYELVQYLDMTRYEGDIDDLMERYVINLMMNAVKNGSQYARDLFLYLHKTYYKKEYRQLKRFHHISGEEFEAILRDSEWGISCIGVAHFATLCMLYGIELSPECNYSYELAGRFYERICGDEEQDDTTNLDDYLENVLDPCLEEVKERFGDVPALYKEYDKMGRFLSLSFRSNGLNEDCCLYGLDSEDYLYHTAYTLTLLKSAFPDRSFTNEEIILCGLAVQMQDALIEDVFSVRRFFGTVFEKQVSHVIAPLFDPAAVSRSPIQQDLPVDGKKRAVPDEKTNDSHSYKESALKEQIEELQQALHVKDGSIKTLRDQIKGLHDELRGYDQAKKEITALKDEVEAHNKELAALREYVYGLTEEDTNTSTVSIDEMKKALRSKKYAIIGGHVNWVSKLKLEFPNWLYIDPKISGTLEGSVIDGVDRVYFFTDTLSHNTYYKYMNIVRSHGLPFSYIHGVNIEKTVRKIYEDVFGERR